MKTITWSELMRQGAGKIAKSLPVEVTVDGDPKFIINKVGDVIVISDLHIRVRNMLRALEKRARAGMPQPEKIS